MQQGYLVEGNCKTGSIPVMKIIKGLPGDRYSYKNGLLMLNGAQYQQKTQDSSLRPLKTFYRQDAGVLNNGEYILISSYVTNSWDSRYWGPVPIEYLLKPLWIYDHDKI